MLKRERFKQNKKRQKHGTGGQTMSDDLISRKALLDRFRYGDKESESDKAWICAVRRMIKEQPTAFDKEKVIEELEYDKEMSAKYSTGLREQGHIEAFDEAISIVKKGGINNILL